ncbi:LCP family protein [Calidifontibacter sp. DB0510]|uniref:LCP family protein n=1 Tax=Metallococcus carri TaxID=1656884 RepID=A0A967B4Z8_9MICO|nr:LCP family protein [Metallococcus carri]NHN57370.1 LCP family protein [Metallococcus carri]NOP39148.1 LCP family protein [Calidifontibacter sp. DB2511S]
MVIAFAVIAALIVTGAAAAYEHFNGNLRTTSLTAGGGDATGDLAKPTPLTILVLGSDSRASAADCTIGGACPTGTASPSATGTAGPGNADVEMLVHLSADRTNASVTSIPRDTIVDIPQCTDQFTGKVVAAHRDRSNSTLNDGPNCTVATVHQLTGVPIDHFMVVDFSGVVQLSNAVGGVQICVSKDVYDPYSHLKLAAGNHTLKGLPALEFLRTRHGFGDGSDLGRASAQHLFLSTMMRDVQSASTLLNPVTGYQVADAATKALTVDDGLGSVDRLLQLGLQFNKIPARSTYFVTMPTVYDAQNRNVVLPGPSAAALFAKIAADQSLAPARPRPSSTPSTSPTASPSPTSTENAAPPAAATTTGCAQVSTERTVTLNGMRMTPTEAFNQSPRVPLSAP